jgi:hypothetical protein
MAIEHANGYIPEIIARKLQRIASENDIQVFELFLERKLSPLWDQIYLLPRYSRAWFYAGGGLWLLSSDDNLFAEPLLIKNTAVMSPDLLKMGESAWSITLDDAAEHLWVNQYLLLPPGQNEESSHDVTRTGGTHQPSTGDDGACRVLPTPAEALTAKFFLWDGERISYSLVFDARDPEGEEQIDAEGQIAGHFFDYYEVFDLAGHTRWVISFVVETFFQGVLNCPVEDVLQLTKTLADYLSTWQSQLAARNDGPDEEEAAQAGRDTLLLILRFLAPEWVQVVRTCGEKETGTSAL